MRDWLSSSLEGARLIRRHPLAVLVWAGLLAASAAALSQVTAILRSSDLSPAGPGVVLLSAFLPVGVVALISGAVLRAVLQPSQSRWFFVRVGAAELRLLVWWVIFLAVWLIFTAVARLPGPALLLMNLAWPFYLTPLCLIPPAIMASRKFALAEGWRAAWGRWPGLFLMNVLILVVVGGGGYAIYTASNSVLAGSAAAGVEPMVLHMAGYLISAVASACGLTILLAPPARVYASTVASGVTPVEDTFT